MQWIGKVVGGVLGYALLGPIGLGPIGSVIGLALGHQLDAGLGRNVLRDGLISNGRNVQRLFFSTTFEVMGHLAKVDGRVSEEEIQIARRIMHAMRLSPDEVQQAIAHFTRGKARDFPLMDRLAELRRATRGDRGIARAFVQIQLQAAIGAGPIDAGKRQLLWETAQQLGVGRVELARIEDSIRALSGSPRSGIPDVDAAYRVLGIARDASDQHVKTAYRRLMSQHHPDKLVSRGLPESMMHVAEQKTQEIRAAYERIKAERGLK